MAGTLASYIDAFNFSENSIKLIKISKKKRRPRPPLPTPKSALDQVIFQTESKSLLLQEDIQKITVTSMNLSLSDVLETPAEYGFF